MIVLGIDPGYALMGWSVVECEGSRMKLINYGCIETKAGVPMPDRLRTLQLGIRDLLAATMGAPSLGWRIAQMSA